MIATVVTMVLVVWLLRVVCCVSDELIVGVRRVVEVRLWYVAGGESKILRIAKVLPNAVPTPFRNSRRRFLEVRRVKTDHPHSGAQPL